MALGSKKDKQPTRAEILKRAAEQDLRRQQQIAAQSATLDRLLTEHQMLEGLVGELAAEPGEVLVPGNVTGYRDKAKEVLANIEKLREDARKKREKQDGK